MAQRCETWGEYWEQVCENTLGNWVRQSKKCLSPLQWQGGGHLLSRWPSLTQGHLLSAPWLSVVSACAWGVQENMCEIHLPIPPGPVQFWTPSHLQGVVLSQDQVNCSFVHLFIWSTSIVRQWRCLCGTKSQILEDTKSRYTFLVTRQTLFFVVVPW